MPPIQSSQSRNEKWLTPQTSIPFHYDNWSQTDYSKRKSNRNRKRSNRRRTLSATSTSGDFNEGQQYGPRSGRNSRSDSRSHSRRNENRNENQYKDYRPRAESSISIGAQSTHSQMTNDSKSNEGLRRGSNYSRDGNTRLGNSGNRGQKNTRWDRDRLSREIWSFYLDNSQSSDLLTRKLRLRDALHKILINNFPKYEVNPFIVGSTANGLANNRSDVDICLVLTEIDSKGATTDEKSNVLHKLMSNSSETKENSKESTGAEKTKVGIIVNYEDSGPGIDKSNVSSESIGTASSGSNGSTDPSIPMLEMVREVLKAYNFVTKMQIIMAKVPILKFVDRISGIEVTLNVNKLVSIRNTHLIHDYTKLDWRLQPLVMVIKAWAQDHDINDAYNQSISSYSLVLMVIHYLQFACYPPVLPCLQKMDPEKYSPTGDVTAIRMDKKPKRWRSENECSLRELLIGFLDYYSYTFCYSKDAISIRLGQTLPKHVVQRYKSEDNQFSHWKYLCVEEPFNRTNTARSVFNEVTFERILSVFRVSHYTLRRYPILDSIMTGKQYSNDYNNVIDQYVNAK